ncbi:hypothetical protein [Amycolatopsis sp. MtRt-6]|uniref:hypothetical protein n=1 Tax=Amycolatopsis sp. MtRt-6 TaxID=2792782 RepID=UPI001A8D6A57|nr:hypothetical protein [Amycolatopsis sp. MtRt-6]
MVAQAVAVALVVQRGARAPAGGRTGTNSWTTYSPGCPSRRRSWIAGHAGSG